MKTAEQTLKAFLRAWKNSNKKQMHLHTTKTWQSTHAKSAFLAEVLKSFSFELISSNVNIADFKVTLNDETMKVRLVCERAPYRGAGPDQTEDDIELCKKFGIIENVAWGVNPVSFRPQPTV